MVKKNPLKAMVMASMPAEKPKTKGKATSKSRPWSSQNKSSKGKKGC